MLRDLRHSPPPYSDCPSRGILAFALLAFIGRRPSLGRGFRHQHLRLSPRTGRMKSESRGSRAEGAAERAACPLLLNPQWPQGLSPHSEDPVLNFQLKSGTPEAAAAPTRPPLPTQSPQAPRPSGALPQWVPGHPTSRAARLRLARRPSSPASGQDAPQGVRLLSSPNFGFPSDTTPSLERAPAYASLHPRSLQPNRGKMKCPARGAPPDFEKPLHSLRERLHPPPATSGQMIFTWAAPRWRGLGAGAGGKEAAALSCRDAAARLLRRGADSPAARLSSGSGLLRLCLAEDRTRLPSHTLTHTHAHTASSTLTPRARTRRSEPLATLRQGLKRPDRGRGSFLSKLSPS